MRLRTYTAGSMGEVMRQVRHELGADAIIVSTLREADGRIRVTAALETEPAPDPDNPPAPEARREVAVIEQALAYHGVPDELAQALVAAAGAIASSGPVMVLAAALDARLRFAPLAARGRARRLCLVGPPGSGKTTTAAKLAARNTLAGAATRLVTIDQARAGAVAQLGALTGVMGLDLATAETPEALGRLVDGCDPEAPLYVDTAGTSPFDRAALARLAAFVRAARAEPVLVLPAGLDAVEAAEVAEAFRGLGAARLIVTRIDITRRLGGLLAAAGARLALAEIGIAPRIADGLASLNPVSLARLLLRDPLRLDSATTEARS